MSQDLESFGVLAGLIELWHQLRYPVFISLGVGFVLYRVYRSLRTLLHQETASIGTQKLTGVTVRAPTPPQTDEKRPLAADVKKDDERLDELPERAAGAGRPAPKRVTGKKAPPTAAARKARREAAKGKDDGDFDVQVMIFYSSLTGTTAKYAKQLQETLFAPAGESAYPTLSIPTPSNSLASASISRSFLPPQLHNLESIDLDDYFVSPPSSPSPSGKSTRYIYLVLVPSYETDSPLTPFLEHLSETHHDFRIDTAPLRSLGGFSVFGFGDSSEWPSAEGKFCKDAVEVDKWLGKLTGGRKASRRMFPVGMGDVNPAATKEQKEEGTAEERLREWRIHLEDAMREYAETGELTDVAEWRTAVESGDEDSDVDGSEDEEEPKEMADLEDLGKMIQRDPAVLKKKANNARPPPLAIDFTTPAGKKALEAGEGQSEMRKDMVPKDGVTYAALTKQGYTIVGSHSGVKICRWTKSALRGRGSCYKYSFYGIRSHLCMETTPSLSCSNKCVFCWRHGTNPVGTTWRWKVDSPEEIFRGVVEGHYRKIKMMKGVPGVRAERFGEAMRIRHCALSLVGEPIFYPYINEFVALLHKSRISSFLVCNAQHPAQLRTLKPVTQLYVSIDASNRDSLRRIDRPLHRDFWERFLECLDILREKRNRQRTVYRLTLVKGFNVEDEARGYADLVERGLPAFVEVKGVTFCGTSAAGEAGLKMENVPFYNEVVAFVEALVAELERRGLEYGIGAEHAHSCCILIASKRFFIDGRWHTLIDYEKFFQLLEAGREFSPEEYVGEPTPEWACWGNGGFNPEDERVYRKGKHAGMYAEKQAAAEAAAREGEGDKVVEVE